MIIDDLTSILDFEVSVQDIRQGLFLTAVHTRHCGLAATLPSDALRQSTPLVKEPGFLLDKSPQELVQLAYSNSIAEAAIGMAAINSLLPLDESICSERNAAELLAIKGRDKNVAMIGHFPFVPKLRHIVKRLWVIEKNPRAGDFDARRAQDLIPRADLVAITGTTLANHTFGQLLDWCRPGTYVVVLGPTTPLSPVLFDHGVDAVCGTRVSNPELVMRGVSQGANNRQLKGVRRLTITR